MDGMAVGIKFSTKELENFQCDVCVLGKAYKVPIYNNPRPRAEKVGQMFHIDMCGPMSVSSINDNRWLCIVVDDVSRLPFPFFMKDKNDAATYIKKYVEMVNTQQPGGVKVQQMHSDGVVSSLTRIWINFSRVKVSSRQYPHHIHQSTTES
jgi:hypothetical protein